MCSDLGLFHGRAEKGSYDARPYEEAPVAVEMPAPPLIILPACHTNFW
jgi:hypothetical protein